MENMRSFPIAAIMAMSLLDGCKEKPIMPQAMLMPSEPVPKDAGNPIDIFPSEISLMYQEDFSITTTPDNGTVLNEDIARRAREVAQCVFRLSTFPDFEGRKRSNGHDWAQIQFGRRGDRYTAEVRNYPNAVKYELHFWLQRAIGGHEIHMVDEGLDGNVNIFETSQEGARALPIYERTMFRNAVNDALKICRGRIHEVGFDRIRKASKRHRMRQ